MIHGNFPGSTLIGGHTGLFLTSILVGAVIALGVRSLFVDAGDSPPMVHEAQPAGDHAGPGHDGHAHGAAPTGADEPSQSTKNPGHAEGAQDAGALDTPPAHPGYVPVLLDLANARCPVMQGDVNGKTFSEWNGLRVGHCCPGCNEDFLENPESLLDEVSPDWREAVAAAQAIDAAEGEVRQELLAAAAKSWAVVRQPVGVAPEGTRDE